MANRLRRAPGKGTYGYDGLGHRVSVVGADGVNRIQVYSQEGQLLYVKPSNAPTGTMYLQLHKHVIAEVTGGTVQYDHTDGLGSPVALTNAAGQLVSRARYEPYGATAAGSTPAIGFGGHVNAAELGLVYMQQRYYGPVAGRFLSIDPVTTDANSGSSFNRYAYANNSPYKYIDPDGRSICANKGCTKSTIDSAITRADGEPTKITFINDDPKGASPDQPIATKTANLIEQVISGANVDSVNINSTTGGIHGANSNHGRGTAVDMNKVDGRSVSSTNEGAGRIQEGASVLTNTRENFGPRTMEKASWKGAKPKPFGDKKLTDHHKTHIHISSQP